MHGKQYSRRHFVRASSTTQPLKLIHSNTSGKLPKTIGGNQYYILFIDDFTHWARVYFLADKTTKIILYAVMHYKHEVEAYWHNKYQIQHFQIQHFHSGNGNEYDGQLFQNYLMDNNIKYEPSPPYKQSMNGVAEWKMHTTNCMAGSILAKINISSKQHLWAEAVTTSVYLRNRLPT